LLRQEYNVFWGDKVMIATRRNIIQGLMALPMVSLLGSCGAATVRKTEMTKDELSFLSALSDTIIPATDTPGALAGNVPQTLGELLKSWASDETRGRWSTTIGALQTALDEGKSGSFVIADAAERTKRLSKLDTAVFGSYEHPLKAYREVKSTIATAYYMSEPGATQELRYDPAPGDFDGDAPVGKTWAT
jgi:gluconate 2-dehydrogenase gamma chain